MSASSAAVSRPRSARHEHGEIGKVGAQPCGGVDQHVEPLLVLMSGDGQDDRLPRTEPQRRSNRVPTSDGRLAEHVAPAGAGHDVDAVEIDLAMRRAMSCFTGSETAW